MSGSETLRSRERGRVTSHDYHMTRLTVVCLECLRSFLLVAKDEVDPEMKVLGDILTLQSITTLTHKVTRVYQPTKWNNLSTALATIAVATMADSPLAHGGRTTLATLTPSVRTPRSRSWNKQHK